MSFEVVVVSDDNAGRAALEEGDGMIDHLKRLFLLHVPEDDPETALSATIFNYVWLGVIALIAIAVLGSLFIFVRKASAAVTTLALVLLLLFATLISRRMNVKLGGALLTLGIWIAFSVHVWLAGGINSIFTSTYVAIIVLAAVLVGRSFAIIVTTLTVALAFGMTFVQSLGYHLPSYYPMPPWSAWFLLLFPIVLILPAINGTLCAFSESVRKTRQEIESRKKVEEALRQTRDELKERVGELNCLYRISQLAEEPGISLDQTLQRIANIIPTCWPFPDIACARIDLGGQEFRTANYKEPVIKQTAQIMVERKAIGYLEVGYLERWQPGLEGPFRKDEGSQIKTVAERVGRIIELEKAKQAFQSKSRLIRTMLSTTPNPFVLKDVNSVYLVVNKAFCDFVGKSEEEIIGKNDYDLFPTEDAEQFVADDRAVMSGRPRLKEEWLVVGKFGPGWLQVIKTATYDEAGECTGLLCSISDISRIKRAEETLRQSEEKLRTIFETSPAGIVLVNPDGRIAFANQKIGDLFSRSCEDLIGAPYVDLVHPDERSRGYEKMRALMAGEIDHVSLERRYRAADGREFLGHLAGRRIEGADSSLDGLVGIITDITDRKRDENIKSARLRLLEYSASHSLPELLQATLDELEALTGSTIGFFHFLEADQRTLSLQAWSTRTLRELCSAQGKGLHYSIDDAGVWCDCVRRRAPVIHNDYSGLPHRRGIPPGHAEVIRELVVPVFRGNRIVAILGVGNKLEDYGASDIETVSMLADLAWDIADRKRMEEQAFQSVRLGAVADLSSGVAHHFNNLLQIVTAGASLSLDDLESGDLSEIKDNLEKMLQSAAAGADVVRRLQKFANTHSDVSENYYEVFDVAAAARNVIALLEPLWKAEPERNGIKIGLRMELEDGCLVRGREAEICEVFVNLLRNAVEALPDGGDIIVNGFKEGPEVVIGVHDTGLGIAQDDLGRVFQPLWSSKGVGIGKGMGLAVVQGLVNRHGGALSVQSKLGVGTTFTIRLPLAQQRAGKPEEPPSDNGKRLTILVIEDEEHIATLLQRMLKKVGHQVFRALSGQEGLRVFEKEQLDLVLCDLGMPGMSGWNVGRAIRSICEQGGIPKPPFILLTGWGGQDLENKNITESGTDMVIAKPITSAKLLAAVQKISAGGSGGSGLFVDGTE